MTHTERLHRTVEGLRKQRAALIQGLEGLSQPQFDFKPAPDSWSVGEVVHHVVLTETVFHRYMSDLLRSGTPEQGASRTIPFRELPMGPQAIPPAVLGLAPVLMPFSIMSGFMPKSLQAALLANPLVKVRTAPAVEPSHGISREDLRTLLDQARRNTLQLLEPVKDWNLTRFRWFHPLMGGHDIYGTLDLIASHDRRHTAQIERVKQDPKFPAP